MMKKNDIIKKLLMLIIALLTIFNNTSYIKAYGGGGGGSSSDPIGSCPPGGPGSLDCDAANGWTASCHKAEKWYESSYIYPKTWDLNGNYLGEDIDLESMFNQTELKGVLAGTYLGLDLYEEKYYELEVRIGSTGIQEMHTCTYEYTQTNCDDPNTTTVEACPGPYKLEEQEGTAETACPSPNAGYALTSKEPTTYKCVATCTKALQACKNKHKPTRPELKPSFTVEFQDSNDINSSNKLPSVEPTLTLHEIGDHDGNWYWFISDKKRFSYRLGKACINVKNGDVRYIGENGSCNPSDDEYEVKELSEYWKYFIPLNANSSSDVSISLNPKEGGELSETICDSIQENHSGQYGDLVSSSGNGCAWDMDIKIPVVQRFYNELEDGKTFKGFNFYYKPIDINEPFPNGLNNTSIWYEWNKDKNNPNISKSYEKMTYYANTSENEEEIRKYNNQMEISNDKKDYPYASWKELNKDGTSNFIKNKDIITSYVDKNSFYNLGCGPKNTNVNNVFKQTECDR